MKNNLSVISFPDINEDAYLEQEKESQLISSAVAYINNNRLSPEESDKYLENFPIPRMFANAFIDILGEEGYRKLENKNAEIIRTRAWENAQ